jgi:dTMP kinase
MVERKAPFIVIEGTDGSGVSTQSELLEKKLKSERREVYLTKEPTNGPAGAMIRLILTGRLTCNNGIKDSTPLDPYTLALLFASDRMDHLYTDIVSKLDIGVIVISDRYYLSSFAYQGLSVDFEWLKAINSQCRKPDLTVFLDVPSELSWKRMQRNRWRVELFEEQRKLESVHQNYLEAIEYLTRQGENIVIINGNQPTNEVHRNVLREVKKVIGKGQAIPTSQLPLYAHSRESK